MGLQSKLEKEARVMGAAYFGVAALSLAPQRALTPYEEKLVSEFSFAISIGVPLSKAVIDAIEDQSDSYALQNYRYHSYEMVNPLISSIALRLSHIVMQAGFLALPVPPSKPYMDQERLYGLFSNKLAANLSGLGWIGKSCLLVTPDRGPRVRWGTVLTNAPLSPGKPMPVEGCGECQLCVEVCPASAFTGKPFLPSEPREERMDARKCHHFMEVERVSTIGVNTCGLCLYICPFGR